MAKKTSDATPPAHRRRATAPRRAGTSNAVPAANHAAPAAQTEPSADEIAQAAYQRYLSRGGSDGQDFDDWLEAERELKKRNSRG